MAWKQDLAKVKQQLGPEASLPVPKVPPKPEPKTALPPALDDEDAVFLSAMGLKPAIPRPARVQPTEGLATPAPIPSAPVPESFQEAVKELKGFKPLQKGPLAPPAPPRPAAPAPKKGFAPPVLVEKPDLSPASLPPDPPAQKPPLPSQPLMPLRFQLAAGMAIEVDGTLDLRGHSLTDAMDRLKDRLGDGMVLGWRSLQVTLGQDPALHDGLLALLASGEAPMVARFAQAPVPMGGTQAWLLYFGTPFVQP